MPCQHLKVSPGLCKHFERKALQKEMHLQKKKRFKEYYFRVCIENDTQFPENWWSVRSLNLEVSEWTHTNEESDVNCEFIEGG